MDNQLFRQRSIDRISSPEQLHDYLRVTTPRLWMILVSVLVLLVGFIVFASTTTMENAFKVEASVQGMEDDDGTRLQVITISLPMGQKGSVESGMEVRIAGETGKIEYIFEDEESLFCSVDVAKALPDGVYEAEIVMERTTPISFLLN